MFRRSMSILSGGSDPFTVLGLPRGATAAEIKAQYHKLAMAHHPDRSGGNDARFKDINKAYEALRKGGFRAAEADTRYTSQQYRHHQDADGEYVRYNSTQWRTRANATNSSSRAQSQQQQQQQGGWTYTYDPFTGARGRAYQSPQQSQQRSQFFYRDSDWDPYTANKARKTQIRNFIGMLNMYILLTVLFLVFVRAFSPKGPRRDSRYYFSSEEDYLRWLQQRQQQQQRHSEDDEDTEHQQHNYPYHRPGSMYVQRS